MNCPICGNKIEDDDLLLVKFYPAKDWWVTYHYKRTDTVSKYTETFFGKNYNSNCGKANIQTVITLTLEPLVSGFLPTDMEGTLP